MGHDIRRWLDCEDHMMLLLCVFTTWIQCHCERPGYPGHNMLLGNTELSANIRRHCTSTLYTREQIHLLYTLATAAVASDSYFGGHWSTHTTPLVSPVWYSPGDTIEDNHVEDVVICVKKQFQNIHTCVIAISEGRIGV